MALEIKLTDSQIRPSLEFLDFLSRFCAGEEFRGNWHDQLSERLRSGNITKLNDRVKSMAGEPVTDPRMQQALIKSYELTVAILLGDVAKLKPFQNGCKFIFVVGCPRSGGSYLTKQIFMALGKDPDKVPGLLAHDGYPKIWPFYLEDGHNAHTDMVRYVAEYIVLSMLFFGSKANYKNKVVIPKKDLNVAYHGAFFNKVFGANAEYVWTIRHPVTCCISTYEKQGGFPQGGRFSVRGNIERFIQRDLMFTGEDKKSLSQQSYFNVYLRYWEQYHYNLILTGIPPKNKITVVPYSREQMMLSAAAFFTRFGSDREAEDFHVFNKRDRHEDWFEEAERAICRVQDMWRRFGMEFPLEQVMEAW
jgi:hypothetical protein